MIDHSPSSTWLAALALLIVIGTGHASECLNNIPPINPDGAYVVHSNETVTDTRTGLMWKQCEEGLSGSDCASGSRITHNWADALALAESSSFADYTDWRLPNINELSTLVELCRIDPAINQAIFPNTGIGSVWSSSPTGHVTGAARSVYFYYGGHDTSDRRYSRAVRLVRDEP